MGWVSTSLGCDWAGRPKTGRKPRSVLSPEGARGAWLRHGQGEGLCQHKHASKQFVVTEKKTRMREEKKEVGKGEKEKSYVKGNMATLKVIFKNLLPTISIVFRKLTNNLSLYIKTCKFSPYSSLHSGHSWDSHSLCLQLSQHLSFQVSPSFLTKKYLAFLIF